MSFISILLALLLEQARPLGHVNVIHNSVRQWVRWVVRTLDTGKPHHAWLAWWLAVALPTVLVVAVHWFEVKVFVIVQVAEPPTGPLTFEQLL